MPGAYAGDDHEAPHSEVQSEASRRVSDPRAANDQAQDDNEENPEEDQDERVAHTMRVRAALRVDGPSGYWIAYGLGAALGTPLGASHKPTGAAAAVPIPGSKSLTLLRSGRNDDTSPPNGCCGAYVAFTMVNVSGCSNLAKNAFTSVNANRWR